MLSVIIPACDEEQYLKRTIDSVRSQKVKEVEVIVVSDGSTDKTDEIASKHADKFLRLEKRQGPAAAKNAGARIAKGDILVFLDADTLLTENVLDAVKERSGHNVVGTCRIKPSNEALRHRVIMSLKNHVLCPFGVSNGIVFCTRKTFDDFGGYREVKKGEDGDFVRKVKGSAGDFVILKNKVVCSTRRFERIGYARVIAYWIKETLNPSDEEYPLIR